MRFLLKIAFRFIYKILSIFNLQPALFFCLLGIVLYFAGVFENNAVVLLIYQLALILSLVYAIVQTVSKMLGLNKKVKKSKGAQILDTDKQDEIDNNKKEKAQTDEVVSQTIVDEKPKYFRVKQNPDYVMAEYSDRYELYQVCDGKLKKIRTDNKS